MTDPALDLSLDAAALTAQLVDFPSVSGDEKDARRRRRARPARAAAPDRRPRRRHRRRPHAPGPRRAGRARRPPRHRADRRQRALPAGRGRRAVGLRHLRHEVRRRRPAADGRHRPRAQPRPDLRLLRPGGGRRRTSTASAASPTPTPTGSPATSPSCWSPPTARWRAAARAPCGSCCAPPASAPTPPAAGWATTPSTTPPRSWRSSPRTSRAAPVIDGLDYREGLNAVRIEGGLASNVIPDACTVTVNFRFAPDRTEDEALRPCPRGLRRLPGGRVRRRRPLPGRAARPVPPGGRGLHGSRRRQRAAQVRLDRRRPLLRARRPGRQLRPRLPAARPHAGRTGRAAASCTARSGCAPG